MSFFLGTSESKEWTRWHMTSVCAFRITIIQIGVVGNRFFHFDKYRFLSRGHIRLSLFFILWRNFRFNNLLSFVKRRKTFFSFLSIAKTKTLHIYVHNTRAILSAKTITRRITLDKSANVRLQVFICELFRSSLDIYFEFLSVFCSHRIVMIRNKNSLHCSQ